MFFCRGFTAGLNLRKWDDNKERAWTMQRIYLSEENKKIAGICGGIGEDFDIDPILVRLGFIFMALATGIIPLVVTYLVAWLILMQEILMEVI